MTAITRSYRLHSVRSFPMSRATFHASPAHDSLAYCAGWRSLHPPIEEIRHGHSWFHRPPIRIRTIGPDSPGTAPRRQLPGAYGRSDAADRTRRLDFHAKGRTSSGQGVEL